MQYTPLMYPLPTWILQDGPLTLCYTLEKRQESLLQKKKKNLSLISELLPGIVVHICMEIIYIIFHQSLLEFNKFACYWALCTYKSLIIQFLLLCYHNEMHYNFKDLPLQTAQWFLYICIIITTWEIYKFTTELKLYKSISYL